jgi:hypothetical protein
MPFVDTISAVARQGGIRATIALALAFPAAAEPTAAYAEDLSSWLVVGTQGLLHVVIVPKELAHDASAYQAQIAKLCPPAKTCFINFYTNSSGVQPELPLPDAIAAEAAARFRRSTKNGTEVFQWSCRLGANDGQCF